MIKKSNIIYILKAIAVLSIISAHCGLSHFSEQKTIVLSFLVNIVSYMGEIGVPIFFILSGYLFYKKNSIIIFWKNKLIKIILPWFFCAFIVWLYMFVQGEQYNIIKWILGIGNIYWYMPVLIIYFAIFYIITNEKAQIVLLVFSIVYHICVYDFGYLSYIRDITFVGHTLQFSPYFIIGIILKQDNIRQKIMYFIKTKLIILSSVMILLGTIIYSYIEWGEINYRCPLFLTFSLSALILAYNVALFVEKIQINHYAVRIGKDSFTIYLLHLPLAGIFSNLLSRNIFTAHMVILYPIIIIFVFEFFLHILRRMRLHYNLEVVFKLLGCSKY